MTLGATLVTSLLATLAHPATWPLALAGFLLRGGIIAFLIPIFVLPTPVGLANLTGPTVVDIVLGGLSLGLLALLAIGVGALLAWIVFGGFLAATLEAELIADRRRRRGRGRRGSSDRRCRRGRVARHGRRGTGPRLRSHPSGAPHRRRADGDAVPAAPGRGLGVCPDRGRDVRRADPAERHHACRSSGGSSGPSPTRSSWSSSCG